MEAVSVTVPAAKVPCSASDATAATEVVSTAEDAASGVETKTTASGSTTAFLRVTVALRTSFGASLVTGWVPIALVGEGDVPSTLALVDGSVETNFFNPW